MLGARGYFCDCGVLRFLAALGMTRVRLGMTRVALGMTWIAMGYDVDRDWGMTWTAIGE